MYLYIEREREREREKKVVTILPKWVSRALARWEGKRKKLTKGEIFFLFLTKQKSRSQNKTGSQVDFSFAWFCCFFFWGLLPFSFALHKQQQSTFYFPTSFTVRASLKHAGIWGIFELSGCDEGM
jgi:hypothetical protein